MTEIITNNQGFFVTVRAGTAYRHLFQSKEIFLFVMYIINEYAISGYLEGLPAPIT